MRREIVSFELDFNQGSSGNAIASNISSIIINQKINAHHTFEIRVRAEAIDGDNDPIFQKSKQSIGKRIKVQLENTVFIGFVTHVAISKTGGGFKGDLIIKGFSPGFILDDKPNTQSFANASLKDIISQVKKVYPGNIINFNDDKISPQHQSKLEYVTQYNESGFQFINRLAADFGEWYYYDGTETYFGLPPEGESIKLYSGSDILNFDISLQVQHVNYKMQMYDYQKNETVNKSSSDAAKPAMDSLSDYAFNTSKNLSGFTPQYINAEVYNLDTPLVQVAGDMVTIDTGMDASQLVELNGVSSHSELKIGSIIEVREKSGADKTSEENLGDYRIISITHTSSGQGNYQNSFKAIPKALRFPPVDKMPRPICPSQPAVVTDNSDSMGRVKVQFYWQKEKNKKTTWIRVLTSHAGDGRGMYFIPEVGDEVLVSFIDNDPDQPYVAGSLYHGKAKPPGGQSNYGKGIITAGGNCIVFSDEKDKQSINIYNGKNKMTFSCEGDGSMVFESEGDILFKSKKNIKCYAKMNFEGVADTIIMAPIENLDVDNPPAQADSGLEIKVDTTTFEMMKGQFIVEGSNASVKLNVGEINAFAGSLLHLESSKKMDLKATEELDMDGGLATSLKGKLVKIN